MSGHNIEGSDNNENSTLALNNSLALSTDTQCSESMSDETAECVEEDDPNLWPDWATPVRCISHLLLALYSSVTFLIYYCKQKTSATRG